MWSEFGSVKAQPWGPWEFFTIDSIDADGVTLSQTATTDNISADRRIHIATLGTSRAYTIRSRGTTETWFGLSGKHSAEIELTYVNR